MAVKLRLTRVGLEEEPDLPRRRRRLALAARRQVHRDRRPLQPPARAVADRARRGEGARLAREGRAADRAGREAPEDQGHLVDRGRAARRARAPARRRAGRRARRAGRGRGRLARPSPARRRGRRRQGDRPRRADRARAAHDRPRGRPDAGRQAQLEIVVEIAALTCTRELRAAALENVAVEPISSGRRVGRPTGSTAPSSSRGRASDGATFEHRRDAATSAARRRRSSPRSAAARRPAGDPARPARSSAARRSPCRARRCRRSARTSTTRSSSSGSPSRRRAAGRSAASSDVVNYPANDVLELDSGVLLPLVGACVRQVDLEGGRIVVS